MNAKKICFICCVNNHSVYKKAVSYIKELIIPTDYSIEILSIKNVSSLTQGYNKAMRSSEAKYKIYLHEDVFILYKNILGHILTLFNKYPKLGMLGVIGTKRLPRNAIWWKSNCCVGKVYDSHTGKMTLIDFDNVTNDYETVNVIDGLIMITQYDIYWREDIFDGWHFYDISQCYEFRNKGYEVGVVKQDKAWCLHDCGIVSMDEFNKYRQIFVKYYLF